MAVDAIVSDIELAILKPPNGNVIAVVGVSLILVKGGCSDTLCNLEGFGTDRLVVVS